MYVSTHAAAFPLLVEHCPTSSRPTNSPHGGSAGGAGGGGDGDAEGGGSGGLLGEVGCGVAGGTGGGDGDAEGGGDGDAEGGGGDGEADGGGDGDADGGGDGGDGGGDGASHWVALGAGSHASRCWPEWQRVSFPSPLGNRDPPSESTSEYSHGEYLPSGRVM